VFDRSVDRTILLTYDGSILTAYVDGALDPSRLELSPGAVLVRALSSTKALDLPGYNVVFLALVLVPAGVLLAPTLPRRAALGVGCLFSVGGLSLLLAGGLELVLVLTSGRFPDRGSVVTGAALCAAAPVCALYFRR
jgi:hypothetical protein